MYKVFIAEDSKPILRNIQTLLTSLDLPLEVVGKAGNGEEALALLREESYDLLLTDIRMPKMDGLSLIAQAKEFHPTLVSILISGYNDFEYMRKAINLQAFDYLLKPVDRQQLADVMQRAVEQLDKQGSRERMQWQEMIHEDELSEIEQGRLQHYGRVLLLFRMQPFSGDASCWERSSVKQVVTPFFHPYPCNVFTTTISHQMLALIPKQALEGYASVYECLQELRGHLQQQGIQASIIGSMQAIEPSVASFYAMSDLLDNQQCISQGIVIDADLPASGLLQVDEVISHHVMLDYIEMIKDGRKEPFLLKLTEQLSGWRNANISVRQLERFVRLLAESFMRAGVEWESDKIFTMEQGMKHLFLLPSYEQFCTQLIAWVKEGFDRLKQLQRKSGEVLFSQIEAYVQGNLYSNLSVSDLAMKFHVSTSYISRIMKKYANTSFVQYYTQLKIREASRLMSQMPNMLVKEISDALSFSDQHYFSKVFKEYTGLSPTEYRSQK